MSPVMTVDIAAQQVKAEPTAGGFKNGLVGGGRGGKGFGGIFWLGEAGRRVDGANGSHRATYAETLIDQRLEEAPRIAAVRVPVAVETTEPRGGEGFVHRSVAVDPRVTPRHGLCKAP